MDDNNFNYSFSVTAVTDGQDTIDAVLLNVSTALRHMLWHDNTSFPLEVTGANGTAVVSAKVSGRNPIYCPVCGCHAHYEAEAFVMDEIHGTNSYVSGYRCDTCGTYFFVSGAEWQPNNGRHYKLSVLVKEGG